VLKRAESVNSNRRRRCSIRQATAALAALAGPAEPAAAAGAPVELAATGGMERATAMAELAARAVWPVPAETAAVTAVTAVTAETAATPGLRAAMVAPAAHPAPGVRPDRAASPAYPALREPTARTALSMTEICV
jgi:hypothetical protein